MAVLPPPPPPPFKGKIMVTTTLPPPIRAEAIKADNIHCRNLRMSTPTKHLPTFRGVPIIGDELSVLEVNELRGTYDLKIAEPEDDQQKLEKALRSMMENVQAVRDSEQNSLGACVDCKFFKKTRKFNGYRHYEVESCDNPIYKKYVHDPVTGKVVPASQSHKDAPEARREGELCGPQGILCEEQEISFLEKFLPSWAVGLGLLALAASAIVGAIVIIHFLGSLIL